MTESEASLAFATLAHAGPRTLLRALIACAPGGLAARELSADLGISLGAVEQGLSELSRSGFALCEEDVGASPLWRVDPAGLIRLQAYLVSLATGPTGVLSNPAAAE